jgi:hypothetical protein
MLQMSLNYPFKPWLDLKRWNGDGRRFVSLPVVQGGKHTCQKRLKYNQNLSSRTTYQVHMPPAAAYAVVSLRGLKSGLLAWGNKPIVAPGIAGECEDEPAL